jgi:serine protease inhibitor
MTTAKWRQPQPSPDRPGDGHRASVDDEGTEGAASTYIGMVGSASPEYTVELTFDRPFAFAIRGERDGSLLFVGTVCRSLEPRPH